MIQHNFLSRYSLKSYLLQNIKFFDNKTAFIQLFEFVLIPNVFSEHNFSFLNLAQVHTQAQIRTRINFIRVISHLKIRKISESSMKLTI